MESAETEQLGARPANTETISCSELRIYLYELVDDSLEVSLCERLQAHVSTCPACAEIVAAEASLRKLLRRCSCSSAPVTLRERISIQLRISTVRRQP